MKKTLVSMPDSKWDKLKSLLTVGEKYQIVGSIGNGYIIEVSGYEDKLVVLQSRFTS